jgi:hypothetical protein
MKSRILVLAAGGLLCLSDVWTQPVRAAEPAKIAVKVTPSRPETEKRGSGSIKRMHLDIELHNQGDAPVAKHQLLWKIIGTADGKRDLMVLNMATVPLALAAGEKKTIKTATAVLEENSRSGKKPVSKEWRYRGHFVEVHDAADNLVVGDYSGDMQEKARELFLGRKAREAAGR